MASPATEPNAFVGRAAELEAIRAALAASRFVLVVGPGGAGKTRLARQILESDGEGALPSSAFADLSVASSKADVAGAMASALDVTLGAGDSDAAAEQIALVLAGRSSSLFVLDNLETIGDGVEFVRRWATAGPRFLATSRVRFDIPGATHLELGPLGDDTAVELFTRRARLVAPEFVADADTRALVARLEGSPLAIELAAARAHVLTPRALLDRFSKHLDLVRGASPALPARHRSLRAVVDGSWALSSALDREALARASVFRGGFDLEAAEVVLGEDAADRVESLLASSLLYRDVQAGEAARFALYESVREYAAERLLEDPTTARDAVAKHAEHFRALADRFAERLLNAEPSALRMQALESENLLASFRADPRSALAFAAVLHRALPADAHAAELTVALAKVGEGDTASRAELELSLARAVRRGGGGKRALEHAERGAELAERSGRPKIVVDSAYVLGLALFDLGRLPEARASAERAIELAGRCDAPAIMARSLDLLGWIAIDDGDFARASKLAEDAVGIARRHGFQLLEAFAENLLGATFGRSGDLAASEAHLGRGLALARGLGHRSQEAIMLGNLAKAVMLRGDAERARPLLEQAMDLSRRIGARKTEVTHLASLAAVDADLGRLADARAWAAHAERLATEIHQPRQIHAAALLLGSIALEERRVAEACGDFERALVAAEAHASDAAVAAALAGLAAARALSGDHEAAGALLAKADRAASDPSSEAAAIVRARAAAVALARASTTEGAEREALAARAARDLELAALRAVSSVDVRLALRFANSLRASDAPSGAHGAPAASSDAPRFELVTRAGVVLAERLPDDADLAFDAISRRAMVDGRTEIDLRQKPVAARLLEVVLGEPTGTFDKPRLYTAVWRAPFRTLSQGSAVYKAVVRLGALLDPDARRFLRWDEAGGLVLAAKRPALLRAPTPR